MYRHGRPNQNRSSSFAKVYFEAEKKKDKLTSAADGPCEGVSPTQNMVVILYGDREGKISCYCVEKAPSFDVALDNETTPTSASNLARRARKK